MKETRIFASPLDMVEQTKEERLQWAEGNGSVMSLNQFLSYINRGLIEENKNYRYDSYETSDDTYESSENCISVPIYYYEDEDDDNKKVYDFEEMTIEFAMAMSKLKS
tara:strand:- start:433 stop:756 length:324 start_codon:yes stop_codon:yes gene_type:complete